MSIYKTAILIREILIYPIAILIFPFSNIRILIWKWSFWIQKGNSKIKQDPKEFNLL